MVRRNGWIVLHYLYFYFMNDYRSTFDGANDHEADWEQVFVYLEDRPDAPRPVWIAAAAHDYIGDQLRRRWDDPTLVKEGDHPVLFAGAGSHASYFEQGEYLTSVPLAAFRGLVNLMDVGRTFWVRTLRQPDPGDIATRFEQALSASFVDYARGDGLAVGPGRADTWTPVQISDADALGGRLPRVVRAGHARSDGWRALAGGPEVQPQRHSAHELARSAGLRRP